MENKILDTETKIKKEDDENIINKLGFETIF